MHQVNKRFFIEIDFDHRDVFEALNGADHILQSKRSKNQNIDNKMTNIKIQELRCFNRHQTRQTLDIAFIMCMVLDTQPFDTTNPRHNQRLLCIGFIMLCLMLIISNICSDQYLSVQGLSFLVFICQGYVMVPSKKKTPCKNQDTSKPLYSCLNII